eukprot:3203668-Rhodomonas_salina.2
MMHDRRAILKPGTGWHSPRAHAKGLSDHHDPPSDHPPPRQGPVYIRLADIIYSLGVLAAAGRTPPSVD